MGATGSGKTTVSRVGFPNRLISLTLVKFINKISGSDLLTSHGLASCTNEVTLSKDFTLARRTVILIDTPGFDDSTISDTDVLKMIGLYLSTTYEKGYKLAGIIYMHRITDPKVGGVSRKNFRMFRKLCGDDTLKNIVIVTNMWGQVDPERGAERELELQTDEDLFKPVLREGATMLRHYNTVASAEAILLQLVHNSPQALRIQQELVDERKDLADTGAGQEVARELMELKKKHRQEVAELTKEIEEAAKEKDVRAQKEISEERKLYEERIAKAQHDLDNMSKQNEEEKKKLEAKIESIKEERMC
ncbi:hypothetical protein PHLCEN_2v9275 [Hermanssonia centrifuga]|uniref:G domain-containing protein n=1 Tax=Hermanssonia centrifuga TaxID=98765 RepID=A0A2R6NS16_9APHY|nr:hypothetical protein PHLCEN_2v9275 [Hermanssonia centrifuga]